MLPWGSEGLGMTLKYGKAWDLFVCLLVCSFLHATNIWRGPTVCQLSHGLVEGDIQKDSIKIPRWRNSVCVMPLWRLV